MMKDNNGFTLVEIMIVLAIFSIIGGAIFATLTMGRESWHTGNVQVEMQQEVRRGMVSMVKELRQSNLDRVTVSADRVAFQIPQSVDASGNITWSGDIVYSLGGLNAEQLLRAEFGVPDRVLANNVRNFNPSISGREITITLITEKDTIFRRSLTAALTSQVTLRN